MDPPTLTPVLSAEIDAALVFEPGRYRKHGVCVCVCVCMHVVVFVLH